MEYEKDVLANDWKIDEEVSRYMYQTAVLAKFVATMGMVFSVLATFKTLHRFFQLSGGFDMFNNMQFLLAIAVAILSGALYFSISLFTLRFAGKLQVAIKQTDQTAFSICWRQFKICYRMMGMVFIVYMGFFLLAVIF